MMQSYNPKEIFDQALASQYGIELVFDDPQAAYRIRRRLYAERDKFRAGENLEYESLSFLIRCHELWIVPREKLPSKRTIDLLDCRPLAKKELPERILSRGKSHVNFRIS